MTTDNRTNEPTAEQILVDEWIRQADRAKSMTGMDAIWFPDAEETLAVLRAHGLLSEGAPSEAQVEAAAKAMWDLRKLISDPEWDALEYGVKLEYRKDARAALVAAQGAAPPVNSFDTTAERVKNGGDSLHVTPELVIDETALAEVIGKVTDLWDEPLDEVHDIPQIARAVAAWLKEGAR